LHIKKEIRIGIDTGGTFTDFVIYHNSDIKIQKIPSTPQNPAVAIMQGISEYFSAGNKIQIIHGTTVATNSLLERKGGKIALITTKGFEDIIFIGRQTRESLYSLSGEDRSFLLPDKFVFGLEESVNSSGIIEKKIREKDLEVIIEKIKNLKIEAVAVCLINSYANFQNENFIFSRLKKENIMASVSSQILPEHREYERTTVTVVNAYLMPVVSLYISNLEKSTGKNELLIMQSNEGCISPATAKTEPIRTALSGPAGGVVAAFSIGKSSGYKNIITLDMGGTSSDVSLIDGKIRRTNESKINEFPIRLPMIDIHTVGAGGGSIAYLDKGGSLRVGPDSAGANPGPACYGKGRRPTVTDANLVLGRLVPDYFLGGSMKIYPKKSRKVINDLSVKIDKNLLETAEGIIEIANANMEKAIRVISIERGIDPRKFILFCFGGAGGMHAAEIASNLNISTILIPKNAGVLSALGLLMADSIKDYTKSILRQAEKTSLEYIQKNLIKLKTRAVEDMKKEGFTSEKLTFSPSMDVRYIGQSYEINIPYKDSPDAISTLIADFNREHNTLYAYYHPDRKIELVNLRLKAVGTRKKIKLKKKPEGSSVPDNAFLKTQDIFYKTKKFTAPIYIRNLLSAGMSLSGPALIVDYESTAFIPPGFKLKVDGWENLIIQKADQTNG